MKKLTFLTMTSLMFLSTSCATIVSKSKWPLTINSTPTESRISITDRNGVEIYTGNTPATLKLKSGAGFFQRARYQVKLEKEGYVTKVIPIEFRLNGWYFGNLLLGGVIGMLIVDPATGAMYKMETEFINETLQQENNVGLNANEGFKVYDINEIPENWKNHLVKLEK